MQSFFALVFLLLTIYAKAQEDDKPAPFKRPEKEYAKDTVSTNQKFTTFNKKKKFDMSKLLIEPNIQFSIRSNAIDIGLAPYVGYRVWKGLAVGGGVNYFYSGRSVQGSYGALQIKATAKFHTYGGGAFALYSFWKGFFARVRFEVLHRSIDDYNNATVTIYPNNTYKVAFPKIERTYPVLFIGAGYNLLQTKNFFFPIVLQYNVLNGIGDKRYAPYQNGLNLQVGFVSIF